MVLLTSNLICRILFSHALISLDLPELSGSLVGSWCLRNFLSVWHPVYLLYENNSREKWPIFLLLIFYIHSGRIVYSLCHEVLLFNSVKWQGKIQFSYARRNIIRLKIICDPEHKQNVTLDKIKWFLRTIIFLNCKLESCTSPSYSLYRQICIYLLPLRMKRILRLTIHVHT